jgi:hypothetical protein
MAKMLFQLVEKMFVFRPFNKYIFLHFTKILIKNKELVRRSCRS